MAIAHAHTALPYMPFPALDVTAATVPEDFRTAPAHREVKWAETVHLCDVDTFSSSGLSNLEADKMRSCFSGIQTGVCQLSIWPLTGRFQVEAFHRLRSHPSPAHSVPPGCVRLRSSLRMRSGGGPGGGTARFFRVPPPPP